MRSADQRGWGRGWPQNNAAKMVTVRAKQSGTTWLVHRDVAPILQFCVDEVERRGYLFDHGPADQKDDWGYANRPIAGTRTPSNHSWGLAIDGDATLYPQGQNRRRFPQWVMDVFAMFLWDNGWDWGNPDPMHFEFTGTVAEARWLVAALAAHHVGGTPAPVPPSAPTLQQVLFYSKQQVLGPGRENPPISVKLAQAGLNRWFSDFARLTKQPDPPDIALTGVWDEATAGCAIVLQKITGENELGLVGPKTWKAIYP